jgi:HAD superfamily hydrolase (TIGR01450 family)
VPRTGGEAPEARGTPAAPPAQSPPAQSPLSWRNVPEADERMQAGSTAGRAAGTGLRTPGGSEVPLSERYDVALLDLDGVVYVGVEGVPGAADALDRARVAGMRLAFVTNNASRTPEAVAAHLRRLGVHAAADEVVTSAQAACHVLAELLPPGARVLVVGGEGLRAEAAGRGFTVVRSADDDPAAVVQGFSPDIGWLELAEASVAVRRGALWVASNLDLTVPSPRGPLPGNGSLVRVVGLATGAEPLSAGKPDPAMHRESVERSRARHPLVVGDRLDTDVEGATRVGCDSMLVLTGVTTAAAVLDAAAAQRPTYLAAGLDGLLTAHPKPRPGPDGGWTCGGWRVTRRAQSAGRHGHVLAGTGDPMDALRALCAATWSAGTGAGAVPVAPGGPTAEAALARLGLGTGAAPA